MSSSKLQTPLAVWERTQHQHDKVEITFTNFQSPSPHILKQILETDSNQSHKVTVVDNTVIVKPICLVFVRESMPDKGNTNTMSQVCNTTLQQQSVLRTSDDYIIIECKQGHCNKFASVQEMMKQTACQKQDCNEQLAKIEIVIGDDQDEEEEDDEERNDDEPDWSILPDWVV